MPLTRLVLLLLVLLLAYSAFTRYQIAKDMADRREVAEEEVVELERQRRQLEQKVEYLSNERGIESELRRQFDVTLPGEEVIVIVEDTEDEVLPLNTAEEAVPSPWYKFWE